MSEFAECRQNEQMSELMSMALDGLLDAADQGWLQRHVATCSVCRSEWEAMQQVSALFEGSPMIGPPLGFAIRVERRLEQKTVKRRRTFGGVALLTSSLSLAGMTVATVALIVVGLVAWNWLGKLPAVQQGTSAVSQVASGMGLVGKGASLFLGDLLLRFGPALIILIGIGLVVLAGLWIWLFIKRPGGYHRNGYA
jgi:predicted anti-sigma-YlaC factor YlaD